MADHEELIAKFIEVSGGEENVAEFYLSSCNWSLEDALSNFLGNQTDMDLLPALEGRAEAPEVADLTSGPEVKSTASGRAATESFEKSNLKPRFATLNDMSKRSSNEEEGQAFYAGGSVHSGQQVLGPPKRKNFREQLTDIFRMGQNQGDGDEASPTPSTSAGASWGQGVRLGMTNNDHTVMPTPESGQSTDKKDDKKPIVVLKLWSQGFSVDDGELRLYDDPENKEFLETVMRGEIPHELLEMGWMVNVDVEDHRQEDYKKTSKAPVFKGSGQALGSPVPNIEDAAKPPTAATATTTNTTNSNNADDETSAKAKLNVDPKAPLTTVQIRLADGSRLAAQFNLSHTVSDIQQYIQNARPQYRERNFILVSSFPTRELKDSSVTIESAGLKNAALMQRLQ